MIKYSKDTCTECDTYAMIVKKLPGKKLCCKCNEARLSDKKVKKPKGDELTFMQTMFNESDKKCEECKCYLPDFHPINVSHILSKGSYPAYRLDPRNINILCAQCHQTWEFGRKKEMKIYPKNLTIMTTLIHEYYNGKNN